MEAFEIADVELRRRAHGVLYQEFLRKPSLSVGLSVLAAGATDPQRPHGEDEVYLVLRGRGRISVAGEDRAVEAGSVVYVPAQAEHRFHSIAEELSIAVFFAPAEGSATRR